MKILQRTDYRRMHTRIKEVSMCVGYMWICMGIYMYGHMLEGYMCICVGLGLIAGVFLDHSTPYVKAGSQTEFGTHNFR